LVELDMEKSEKIAELENDCNEAIEELNVSTSLYCAVLLFYFHVAQSFHLLMIEMNDINS
jgi:hypothetical protein